MFLALLRYKVPREELDAHLPAHTAFLEEGYAKNDFIVSGRMMNDKGGVILSPITRRGEFEQLLKNDPFMVHDLADYEIISFDPSRFHPDFAPFIRELEREVIELLPYTPEWETLFQAEATRIKHALGDTLLDIHHIGSTSIPGTLAKPIVDMLPVVKDIHVVDRLTPSLQALGYEARGEFGIPGRRFFMKREKGKRTFNVHIFAEGHPDIERHLRFRDYLKNHPDDADSYSRLKKDLVKQSPDDIERYCWGKEDFVKAIELKAFLWR
ncbi:MAG TPA: GrpB family protein [Alphaproteobacteria bacterium]|nr:GrpB family protein [Alphaproteobacteria bacterium]